MRPYVQAPKSFKQLAKLFNHERQSTPRCKILLANVSVGHIKIWIIVVGGLGLIR